MTAKYHDDVTDVFRGAWGNLHMLWLLWSLFDGDDDGDVRECAEWLMRDIDNKGVGIVLAWHGLADVCAQLYYSEGEKPRQPRLL